MDKHKAFIHPLEVNGFRPLYENLKVKSLADAHERPAVSGGDRHGAQPNTVVNLTAAQSFAQWVREVRYRPKSHVLFLNEYRRRRAWRALDTLAEALVYRPDQDLNWEHWSQRVFYRENGRDMAVRELWNHRIPPILVGVVELILLNRRPCVRTFFNRWLSRLFGLWSGGINGDFGWS